MSAPTRGLSWVPAPVPGTTDRYSIEPRDAYDGAERYRLSLTYDQACEVAQLLDEADRRDERDGLAEQRDDEWARADDAEDERDELAAQVDDLKAELADMRERLTLAETERATAWDQLDAHGIALPED